MGGPVGGRVEVVGWKQSTKWIGRWLTACKF